MKRRQFCQAVVALPVAGLLLPREASGLQPFKTYLPPGVWCGNQARVKGEFVILPTVGGKFAEPFQRACEGWLREHPGHRPVGDLYFEPCLWDHSPWLLHPSWTTPGSPAVLRASAEEAFRRPMLIDRAMDLRQQLYWREDNFPVNYSGVTQAELDARWSTWRAWWAAERPRLGYVVVRFDADPA